MLKGASREEIFSAVRAVNSGGSLLGPAVAERLLDRAGGDGGALDPLTAREVEVLGLISRGLRNRQIAERLFVTERIVKFHVGQILAKLGAHNHTEAARIAAQRGLVEPP